MVKFWRVFKIAVAFSFSVIFLSCDNFLASSLLKDEIKKEIEYANAQEIEVFIGPELNQGTTIPSGSFVRKAGYEFEINFAEAPNYQFYKWVAVNTKTDAVCEESVIFTNAKSTLTTAKIKEKVSDLWIKPVCFERPAVEKNFRK